MSDELVVVAIGRNEGERLKRCLRSVVGHAKVVYVDSASSDDSVAFAQGLGVHVVALDMRLPFSAARARNEGFAAARQMWPSVRWVQFVDGDCEIHAQWLDTAQAFLQTHPEVAVVCGRRRERHPEASVYNALCDVEWNTPAGQAKACGGDALMRADAFEAVHGYRADVIAGEEPELCVRLRQSRWQIWRIDAEMTLHDANITHLQQWWTRATRCGYAFALGAHLHGRPPERHWVAETRRALLWAAALPAGVLALGALHPGFLVGLLIYPAQILRLRRHCTLQGRQGWQEAGLMLLGKWPETAGIARFWRDRILGQTPRIIEYK
jgi:glycosyltransferase involved in cell wall biosynthesis